ncbi:GPP34 family phosphoprotein [Ureibacillus sp. FSL K6-3587]|uniref:GOLPH3/VPS74 family protein n=1 Tax=Ureibacillus sp. FSL K6-3587 TaxID=2954681 RepID=UPI003158FFA9
MELFYRGMLMEKDQKLVLVESKRTGLEFLDAILDIFSKQNKNKSLLHWMINLPTRGLRTRHRIANHLVQKKILKPARKRFLYIIPVKSLLEVKSGIREEIFERMREKLLRCALMDEQTLGLALLMKQAGVLRRYFPEQDVSKIEYTFQKLQNEKMGNISFRLIETINSAYKTLGATKWESLGMW